jgi:hypothetical protein
MEKRLCLTSCFFALPVCGAGGLCLLDGFAPFDFPSRPPNIQQIALSSRKDMTAL